MFTAFRLVVPVVIYCMLMFWVKISRIKQNLKISSQRIFIRDACQVRFALSGFYFYSSLISCRRSRKAGILFKPPLQNTLTHEYGSRKEL